MAPLVAVTAHADVLAAHGLVVDPPRSIQPVVLQDQDGRDALFPSPDDRWRLVVFGFTNCPDVCPMTLHKTARLLQQLKGDGDRVQVTFISIDGSRDDTSAMKAFVGKFDPRITGLTGDVDALQAMANEFGVLTRRYQGKTALAYTLVHSSLIYLLDPAGQVRLIYPQKVEAETVATDLKRYWAPSAKADFDR